MMRRECPTCCCWARTSRLKSQELSTSPSRAPRPLLQRDEPVAPQQHCDPLLWPDYYVQQYGYGTRAPLSCNMYIWKTQNMDVPLLYNNIARIVKRNTTNVLYIVHNYNICESMHRVQGYKSPSSVSQSGETAVNYFQYYPPN